MKLETRILDDLAHCNIRGEWFTLPSNTDYQKIIDNAEQKLNMLNESSEEVSRARFYIKFYLVTKATVVRTFLS